MAEFPVFQGDLQTQLMSVLWRLGEGTVEQVRAGLPKRYQSAYTTVQTVLNRLVERGILTRERGGNAFIYRPRFSEAQYVSQTIEQTLSEASSVTRQVVLAQLVGSLDAGELSALQELAHEIDRRRARR